MDTTAEAPTTAPRPRGKSRAKQSPDDRRKRLEHGDCPIHGLFMSQIGPWITDHRTGAHYFIGICGRKDCHILVRQYNSDEVTGHWSDGKPIHGLRGELLPEWEYLLEPGGDEGADVEVCREANRKYRAAVDSTWGLTHDPSLNRAMDNLARGITSELVIAPPAPPRLRPMQLPTSNRKMIGGKKRRRLTR